MTALKKILVLMVTCALLLGAMPGAYSAAEEDLAGSWETTIDASGWKLILNTDGTYFSIFNTEEGRHGFSGTWSAADSRLQFSTGSGLETLLDYRLAGDELTIADFRTGEDIILFRMHPLGPSIPPEITGNWTGEDGGRRVYVILEPTGRITVDYEKAAIPDLQGTFVVKDDALDIVFTDGRRIALAYSAAEEGGGLILADERTGAKLTLTRNDADPPSVFLIPGSGVQWDDWSATPAPGLYTNPRSLPVTNPDEPFVTAAPTPSPEAFGLEEWQPGEEALATVPPYTDSVPFVTIPPAGAAPSP